MNSLFIDHINEKLRPLFETFTGAKVYGLSQSLSRRKVDDSIETFPATVDKNGEGKYIGIDTSLPLQIYHKSVTLSTSVKPGTGFGDQAGDYVNLYSNVIVVFLNRTKTNLLPDELFLYVQANFPEEISLAPYNKINVRITSVILNTLTVLNAEYQNISDLRIGPEHNMFAVNYTVESTFNKHCFEKCPEC